MAGKISKKSNDNFEKMKREMISKKQKASMPPISEVSIIDIEHNNLQIQKDDRSKKLLIDNSHIVNKIQLLVFHIGEEEFAIRLLNVKEIMRVPSMTKMPNAPLFIAGLCNLRDGLLPVIDSRKLFGMKPKEYNDSSRIIITVIHGKQMGITSDKVSQVINIKETAIKEPPSSIKGLNDGVINGILILDNGKRVVMVLDSDKVIKSAEFNENKKEWQGLSEKTIVSSIMKVEEKQIIIFTMGSEEYAVNINHVKEIIRIPNIMKIPNTAKFIEGLFSIRGKLLAVLNLGQLLDIDCKKPDIYNRVVIIDDGSFSFGIIVDRVIEVISFENNLFIKQSKLIGGSSTEYIKGVINLNDGKRLVMMLEPNKLIKLQDVNSILELGKNKTIKDKYLNVGKTDDRILENIIIFKIDSEEYGIRVKNIHEINRINKIVNLPGAPAFINGMVNIRGEAIPILNLKMLFNNDSCKYESSKFLVVEFDNKTVGIMIDSASEVLRIPKNYFEEVSKVFDENNNHNYIDKIAKLNHGKRIVLILNLDAVLSFM